VSKPSDIASVDARTMALSEEAAMPFKLHLRLNLDLPRKVCDLSGRVPFQIVAQISRTRQGDVQKQETPVSVLADGTPLDMLSALQNGTLRILPMKSFRCVDEDAEPIEILPFPERSAADTPSVLNLGPASKLRRARPHCVLYTLDVSRMRGMEDGKFYKFEFRTIDSEDAGQPCRIWWQFRPDPAQQPDLESPSENPAPKISYHPGMTRFKAVAKLAIPPRFEYRLSVRPSTISLSNPTDFTVSVETTLKEAITYTVYSNRLDDQPLVTVLHDCTSLFCFDLVDLNTQEVISGEAAYCFGCRSGSPAFAAILGRDCFREFQPEKTYNMTLTCSSHEPTQTPMQKETLKRGLRIEEPEKLVGRRLGLKLKPMDAWWVAGTIEDLFAGKDRIAKDIYTNPLVIQSDDYAAISIEK
jgi:hypothetical protein